MTTEQSKRREDLIQQIKEGNQLAFSQLHDEYQLPLFYFTNKLVQEKFESNRIVSETFLKLWQLRQNFDSVDSMAAFLYVTCRNAGLDFLRHQQTEKSKREVSLEDYHSVYEETTDETILNQMVQSEVVMQILQEINKLPPLRKSVLELIYIEGLKIDEVAERLNTTPQNVRNTKFQALKQLRNLVIERKIISLLFIFSSAFY